MLKHEDNPELPPHSAAEARATPEELAAAITRLDARKDADQRQAEGTVAIGEVVQQLGLDATPEELLAEVQAGRAQQAKPKKGASRGQRLVLALGLSGVLLGFVLNGFGFLQSRNQAPPPAVVSISSNDNSPKSVSLNPNLLVRNAFGKIVTVSELGENESARCGFDGGNLMDFSADDDKPWRVIKHRGQVYLCGYIAPTSDLALQRNGAHVWVNDSQEEGLVPVTLPLKGFLVDYVASGPGTTEDFEAHNVHLDKHAYEK